MGRASRRAPSEIRVSADAGQPASVGRNWEGAAHRRSPSRSYIFGRSVAGPSDPSSGANLLHRANRPGILTAAAAEFKL
jgi:hypothetical protein